MQSRKRKIIIKTLELVKFQLKASLVDPSKCDMPLNFSICLRFDHLRRGDIMIRIKRFVGLLVKIKSLIY
jgi:hypothetical protein